MDNQSQFFYSSIFKISISPKNYHFSSLDWAFKLICEKSGITVITPADVTAPVSDLYSFDIQTTHAVPEPLTILGAGTAISFGAAFKRKLAKKKADKA